MKKPIIADQKNIGLLIDRFRKFIKRNAQKNLTFEVKQVWGKPEKREKWGGNPKNMRFSATPKVSKHFNFGIDECLLSIQPQSEKDVLEIHFAGVRKWFNEHYPGGIDFTTRIINSCILEVGDRVIFKNEGILVVPKRPNSIKGICSWMLTAS